MAIHPYLTIHAGMISQFGVTTILQPHLTEKFCGGHRHRRVAAFCKARPASRCNNFHPWPVKIPTRWHFANDTFNGCGWPDLCCCAGQFAGGRPGVLLEMMVRR